MNNQKSRVVSELLIRFLIWSGLAGLCIFACSGVLIYERYSSHTWSITTGEIIDARVVPQENMRGDQTYHPKVFYTYKTPASQHRSRYSYSDRSVYSHHSGERISFDPAPSFPDTASAEVFLESYVAGESVTVYYNPNRPRRSVLTLDYHQSWFITPSWWTITIILTAILYIGLKSNTNTSLSENYRFCL